MVYAYTKSPNDKKLYFRCYVIGVGKMSSETSKKVKTRRKPRYTKAIGTYNLMMAPGIILLILFSIVPMGGIIMAFENYKPGLGMLKSPWVGTYWFKYIFIMPNGMQIIRNTLVIAIGKIIAGLIVPIVFALLLNEIRNSLLRRGIQTVIYLPHFLSWVILGGIVKELLSLDGVVNRLLGFFGIDSIFFMANAKMFPAILVITDVWKEFGFGTIVYLAAIMAVDTSLYESAAIDGAGRWKQLTSVTLPAIMPTIILMATLALGKILNAGFDQVYNMYNPLVYSTGDIIDTFVYRAGLVDMKYSLATAVGLFKSLISLIMISVSYFLANKFAGYQIF